MENSIYLALSKQMVLQTNLDIVANNIANMNTNGFRGQNTLFKEYLFEKKENTEALSFVTDYGQYQMTDPGPVRQTENTYDVALTGSGFLGVQMPDGTVAYTRDGNFQRAADGKLVTATGYTVMGQGGPIQIPADSTEVTIDESGMVSNQNGQIARLMVSEFDNVQVLEPIGNNLYTSPVAGKPAAKTVVAQGFLEGSNVRPVVEMNRMVEILRQFQGTQKLLETEHERLRSAIQKLSQA